MQKASGQLTCWSDIKDQVQQLNSAFYKALEACRPSDDLPLLIAKYPYGHQLSDRTSINIPKGFEHLFENSDVNNEPPLTFVLNKEIEHYYDTAHNHLPAKIYTPGDYFLSSIITTPNNNDRFHSNSIFTVTSGIRDVTLLSLHSSTKDFYNLRRKYDIPATLNPAEPLNHFYIFKKIVEVEQIDWHSTVLIFPKAWQAKLQTNKKWWPFKELLLKNALSTSNFHQSLFHLNQAIHDITRSMGFQFRPYAHEIIRQIIFIATGQMPGFRPANSNDGLPLTDISLALKNSVREILNYPTIMKAAMMTKASREHYIYNSITYNTLTTHENKVTPNNYLNEIMIHLKQYLWHFKDHLITRNTIYAGLYDGLEILACSTRGSKAHDIKKCIEMYTIDQSFYYPRDDLKLNARYGAPINAQFCKGFLGFRWHKPTKTPVAPEKEINFLLPP